MYGNHCAPLIRLIHAAMEKQINSSVQNADLTHAQFCMLHHLMQEDSGLLSMKALEKRQGLAQSTTAGLVKRTEEKGLVECLPDPDDRRSKQVRITPLGRARFQETVERIHLNEEWLLQALTLEERVQFHDMLLRVYRSISSSASS